MMFLSVSFLNACKENDIFYICNNIVNIKDIDCGHGIYLRESFERNHFTIVKILLKYGSDINYLGDFSFKHAKKHSYFKLIDYVLRVLSVESRIKVIKKYELSNLIQKVWCKNEY